MKTGSWIVYFVPRVMKFLIRQKRNTYFDKYLIVSKITLRVTCKGNNNKKEVGGP